MEAPLQVSPDSQPSRVHDVQLKHQRMREFLEDLNYDAVLLESPENFAWFTSGGINTLGFGNDTCASLFIDQDSITLIVDESHADRLSADELQELPLEIKSIPWAESFAATYEELRRGYRVASDRGTAGTTNEAARFTRWRIQLTEYERIRYREVGRVVSHAIEATARNIERNTTEAEIAGELSHRLLKHQVIPHEFCIAADDRIQQWTRPIFSNQTVNKRCWISVSAAKYGLCATAGRFLCFEKPDEAFVKEHQNATIISAAGIYFAQPNVSAEEIMQKMQRHYDKFGFAGEFLRTAPGHLTGYRPCELRLRPESDFRLQESMALVWQPMIQNAISCDTVIIDEDGFEIVTGLQYWPHIMIEITGQQSPRPDVLVR